ncbi:MAG: magnesium transporter CorA family protein [Thermoplasmatota archaeon]
MRCFTKGDSWQASEVPDAAAAVALRSAGPVWIRAGGQRPEVLTELGRLLGLHPLAVEDAGNARQRPKVESYAGLTFIVLRVPRRDAGGGLTWRQAALFLGPDFLVSASPEPLAELDRVEGRLEKVGSLAGLFHEALDALVDAWFPYVEEREEEAESLEDHAAAHPDAATQARIRDLKRELSTVRKVVPPMRDALLSLERAEYPNVPPEARVFLRDVVDHMVRIAERLEYVREVTQIAQEAWNGALAARQNRVMQRLTVLAALLLVPSLLAGLGGMNFEGIPDWEYWPVTGTIVGLALIGLAVAWRQRWL